MQRTYPANRPPPDSESAVTTLSMRKLFGVCQNNSSGVHPAATQPLDAFATHIRGGLPYFATIPCAPNGSPAVLPISLRLPVLCIWKSILIRHLRSAHTTT